MKGIVIPVAQARPRLTEILERVRSAPVTITKDGVPAAVVLAADDYESLVATMDLMRNARARKRFEVYEQQCAQGDLEWVTDEEAERQLLA